MANEIKQIRVGTTDYDVVDDGAIRKAASSTDNAVARFDGATGKAIQNSSVTIDDDGKIGLASGADIHVTAGGATIPVVTHSLAGGRFSDITFGNSSANNLTVTTGQRLTLESMYYPVKFNSSYNNQGAYAQMPTNDGSTSSNYYTVATREWADANKLSKSGGTIRGALEIASSGDTPLSLSYDNDNDYAICITDTAGTREINIDIASGSSSVNSDYSLPAPDGSAHTFAMQDWVSSNTVKTMAAPSSTTLTSEQKAAIIEGCFINGEFLGYHNPILCPAYQSGNDWFGQIIAQKGDYGDSTIGKYKITTSTSVISLASSNGINFDYIGNPSLLGVTYIAPYNNTVDLGATGGYNWRNLYMVGTLNLGNNCAISAPGTNTMFLNAGGYKINIQGDTCSAVDNTYSLGYSTQAWKNAYIKGQISDGTNSITVANIESKANKVASWSTTTTDTNFPTEKLVKAECDNIRAVAEGKCKSYVLSYYDTAIVSSSSVTYFKLDGTSMDYNEAATYVSGCSNGNGLFNSQSSSISMLDFINPRYFLFRKAGTVEYWVVLGSELSNSPYIHIGDIFLVIETDVPDRWLSTLGGAYKLETTKVDISHMVTDNTSQTILADKTFGDSSSASSNSITFADSYTSFPMQLSGYNMLMGGQYNTMQTGGIIPFANNAEDFGTNTLNWKDAYIAGGVYFNSAKSTFVKNDGGDLYLSGHNGLVKSNSHVRPTVDNSLSLGAATLRWKDIYANGIAVIDSFQNSGGTVTLTNAQYALFTAGMVQVRGTFLGMRNPIFLCPDNAYNSTYYGIVISGTGSWGNTYISKYSIAESTKILTVSQKNYQYINFAYDGMMSINGVKEMIPYGNNIGAVGSSAERFNTGHFNELNANTFSVNGSGIDCGVQIAQPYTPIEFGTGGENVAIWGDPDSQSMVFGYDDGDLTECGRICGSMLQGLSIGTQTTGGASEIGLKFWKGTQAQYNSISSKDANTFYIIVG